MDGSPDDDAEHTAVERVDRRQLLLVAFCLVAVLVAALLAPPPVSPGVSADAPSDDRFDPTPRAQSESGGASGESGGDATGGGGGDSGDSGGSGAVGDSNVVGDDGEPIPIPGGEAPPTADGCGVLLEDEPVPGSTATVGVFEDRIPVSDTQVRFNGEPIGRTDENGRVSGQVPYNRTLSVSVDRSADCEFYRERWESTGEAGETALGPPGGAQAAVNPPGDARAAVNPPGDARAAVNPPGDAGATGLRTSLAGVVAGGQRHGQVDRPENATGEYAVRGAVDLSVRGEPYPGSSLTLAASVEDVPMGRAAVTLDGSNVARTNASGLAAVAVPDGRQSVTVTVSRGDFAGEATVDVLLLTASVRPREGFPLPGEPAAVNASVDGDPTGDVSVSVAGQRLGTTTPDGTLGFSLPAVPRGDVVASTERQSASVSLWSVYAPTLVNVLVVCWLGVAAVGATRPWRATASTPRVALGWGGFAVADAALIVGELLGLGLALLGMGLVGLVHYRRRVRSGGERAAGTAVSAVVLVRRVALEITVALESLVDRLRGMLGRVWARMTSFETFAAWVGSALRKVVAVVWLSLTLRRVGVALLALAELAVANARWGDEGLVASVAGLSILGVLVVVWRYVRADPAPAVTTGEESTRTGPVGTRRETPDGNESEERIVSIRKLWRTFARWVVPGAWRTQTPGEVARAAVDRGFPPEPVEALTDAFRDVEYGSEPATTRRERAKAAFDRLARSRGEDDE